MNDHPLHAIISPYQEIKHRKIKSKASLHDSCRGMQVREMLSFIILDPRNCPRLIFNLHVFPSSPPSCSSGLCPEIY